jgi:hypothetical protein
MGSFFIQRGKGIGQKGKGKKKERGIREGIRKGDKGSGVVLDGEVLATDHAIALEPLASELLGGAVGGVGPLDGDAVVVGVLLAVGERVARDRDEHRLLRVENARGRIHAETLHVGRLEGPADAAAGGVDHLGGQVEQVHLP